MRCEVADRSITPTLGRAGERLTLGTMWGPRSVRRLQNKEVAAAGERPETNVLPCCGHGELVGVKGSQVQILSSRQGHQRPVDLENIQVGGPSKPESAERPGW
jgi:hypothetical protein